MVERLGVSVELDAVVAVADAFGEVAHVDADVRFGLVVGDFLEELGFVEVDLG